MFTVSIRVIAFMNSPEIVVYLYWISLLVLVIVAVDFIVSVFTSIAVEVSNIVFVLTSIEIICEISLLASDFAEAPAAFTFIDELVNGTDVPQVVTLVLVPLLLPKIFVPLISKLVLYCEFSILLLLLPELPMKIPLTVGEYPRTWESFITVEPPVPINPPVIAASPPVIIPDV